MHHSYILRIVGTCTIGYERHLGDYLIAGIHSILQDDDLARVNEIETRNYYRPSRQARGKMLVDHSRGNKALCSMIKTLLEQL